MKEALRRAYRAGKKEFVGFVRRSGLAKRWRKKAAAAEDAVLEGVLVGFLVVTAFAILLLFYSFTLV